MEIFSGNGGMDVAKGDRIGEPKSTCASLLVLGLICSGGSDPRLTWPYFFFGGCKWIDCVRLCEECLALLLLLLPLPLMLADDASSLDDNVIFFKDPERCGVEDDGVADVNVVAFASIDEVVAVVYSPDCRFLSSVMDAECPCWLESGSITAGMSSMSSTGERRKHSTD